MIDKISLFFWGISIGMIIVWIISANLECRNSLPKKKRGDEIVVKYEGSWYRIGEAIELKKVLSKKEVVKWQS